MAGGGSDSSDGSDIFWPGYVDATTNLILNLLFLLTILIVAVFMFALELGRAVGPQDANAQGKVVAEESTEITDPLLENQQLRSEVERLKKLLAAQSAPPAAAAGEPQTVEGSSRQAEPKKGLDKALGGEFAVMVRFKDDAVRFTPEEHERMLQALKPVTEKGAVQVVVEVPEGFSEAKRMGFYRALAVRNLLIEMKVPASDIDVSVIEGDAKSNASVVKVRSLK